MVVYFVGGWRDREKIHSYSLLLQFETRFIFEEVVMASELQQPEARLESTEVVPATEIAVSVLRIRLILVAVRRSEYVKRCSQSEKYSSF